MKRSIDHHVADSMQNVMEMLRERGTLRHLAGESECGGIEQPPRRFVTPIMLRPFPLAQHIPNALHASPKPPPTGTASAARIIDHEPGRPSPAWGGPMLFVAI